MIYTSKHTIFIAWLCSTLLWACNSTPVTNHNNTVLQDTLAEDTTYDETDFIGHQNFHYNYYKQWDSLFGYVSRTKAKYNPDVLFDYPINTQNDDIKTIVLGITATDWMYKYICYQDNTKECEKVKKLLQELNIEQPWDCTLSSFENKGQYIIKSIDSLLYEASKDCNLSNKQSKLLTWGTWIEFQYIVTKIVKLQKQQSLHGDAKFFINEFKWFFDDPKQIPVAIIDKYTQELETAYQNVSTTIEFGPLEEKEIAGIKTFIAKEIFIYTITQADVDSLASVITRIRNELRDEVTKTDTKQ